MYTTSALRILTLPLQINHVSVLAWHTRARLGGLKLGNRLCFLIGSKEIQFGYCLGAGASTMLYSPGKKPRETMTVNSAMKNGKGSKNKHAARCTGSKHKPASQKGPSVQKPASAVHRASKQKQIKSETIDEKIGMRAMSDKEDLFLKHGQSKLYNFGNEGRSNCKQSKKHDRQVRLGG